MDDDRAGKIIDMASGKRLDALAWYTRLQRNEKGAVLPTVANAMVICANDPTLRGLLAFNAFRSEHLLTREPPPCEDGSPPLAGPYPRSWGAEDVALIQAYVQRVWCSRFARGTVEDAMLAEAAVRRFHPVVDWLDALRWDGKRRLDLWLTNTFDCENNAYHRAVGAKFLIAAVRRVRHPGCKFDYMLVLEGAQGIGKSRSLEELFGHDWFSDAIPPDLSSRDAAMALLGVWCLEFAEIEHLIRNEVETIKAFLSRSVDRYRPPYGRAYVDRPRQGVLVGTTNSEDYLRDSTGNRRVWPVRCSVASPDWVRVNRLDLWAEAAVREAAGEPIWLQGDELQLGATEAQAQRMTDDMWHDAVAAWLVGRTEVKIPHILSDALSIPRERQGKAQEMRVASVLRQLGWIKSHGRRKGGFGKLWFAPGFEELPPQDTTQTDLLN